MSSDNNSRVLPLLAAVFILLVVATSPASAVLTYQDMNDTFHNFTYLYNGIKLQVRSCTTSDCSGSPNFIGPDNSTTSWFNNSNYNDLSTVNLSRTRYFQYRAYLWTDNTTVSPRLWNVSLTYGDVQAPVISLISPANTTYSVTSPSLNYAVSDANLDKVWYLYNGTNTTLTGNTTFTALNNQQSTLWLYANDTAGNVNVTNVTFTVAINYGQAPASPLLALGKELTVPAGTSSCVGALAPGKAYTLKVQVNFTSLGGTSHTDSGIITGRLE